MIALLSPQHGYLCSSTTFTQSGFSKLFIQKYDIIEWAEKTQQGKKMKTEK